jgi:hypothetical protein
MHADDQAFAIPSPTHVTGCQTQRYMLTVPLTRKEMRAYAIATVVLLGGNLVVQSAEFPMQTSSELTKKWSFL